MRVSTRGFFLLGGNALNVATLALLLLAAAGIYMLAPTANTVVEAQKAGRDAITSELPSRPDRLAIALDFRSAHNLAVYGGGGMNLGNSTVRGERPEASTKDQAGQDLARAHKIINQLDCTKIEDGDLTGRVIAPGVYCLGSVRLGDELTLDGQGDSQATFVFRVKGDIDAERGSGITMLNEALPQNVYFVADGKATVADGVTFNGTILSRGDITLGAGSDVKGRAWSLTGQIVSRGESAAGGGTGLLEICKEATTERGFNAVGLRIDNHLLRFNLDNADTEVATPVAITGTVLHEHIRGIDFRPATGVLYGVSDNNLYTLDPVTGVATLVGSLGTSLVGAGTVGFDFNPVADAIRIVTDTDLNLSVNPNTGAATAQTPITPALSHVGSAAYTNNFAGATSTTLYTMDDAADTLNIQSPPASGVQTVRGPLGVNAGSHTGFDIAGPANRAFATINNGLGVDAKLYKIDLPTGNATFVSSIDSDDALHGLAITPGAFALDNRIFRFQIGGNVYYAPVGGCTGYIELPVGNVLITELNSGPLIGGAGTDTDWVGRFKLINVTSPTPGALGAVNLPQRTANVFIREGSFNNLTRVNFFNEFAITGVIEICKRAYDSDINGFYDFTIDAIPNRRFTVPAHACSASIFVEQVAVGQPVPGQTIIRVTELANPSIQLEYIGTFPANRLVDVTLNKGIQNSQACSNIGPYPIPDGPPPPGEPACLIDNPGGGFVTVNILEGGVSNQTTLNFHNRSRPGEVKVCKIAGPGIPIGMIFRFRVRGTRPSNTFPGTQYPGVGIDTTVDVAAGYPGQNGFCEYVDALFMVDFPVLVTELPQPPGGFGGPQPTTGVYAVPPGEIRIARIRINGVPYCETQDCLNAGVGETVARRETVEVEFTNYVFRPTALKICKAAGPGVAVGTPFTFSIVIEDENDLFAGPGTLAVPNLVVNAGSCQFAQGPYSPPISPNPVIGAFRFRSTVYVTEAPAPGTTITGFSSPSGNPIIPCVPANTRCRGMLLDFPGGVNEIVFTNAAGAEPGEAEAPFDFDGDGRTDVSVTRIGGASTWYQLVGENLQFVQFNLGQTGDLLVPADYDGDGKTQAGVFRPSTGDWWVMSQTESVAVALSAGAVGDIPLPSDYTGDGKADFILYRPSTNQWLRYANGSTATSHMFFGSTGDKPLMGDFDGDGKSDPAVFRPSTGTFWYASSAQSNALRAEQWGASGDIPAAADYDGDGKTDMAIFRPSDGTWWIRRSSDLGLTGVQWGGAGDRPMAGDWDGDGRADIALFRPSNGHWYIIKSSGGFQGYQWGISSDIPTPGVYIP